MLKSKTEYYKKYCEKNKESLRKKRKEIITCEFCNIPITKGNMYKHKKTTRHKLLVEKAETEREIEELQEELKEIMQEIEN